MCVCKKKNTKHNVPQFLMGLYVTCHSPSFSRFCSFPLISLVSLSLPLSLSQPNQSRMMERVRAIQFWNVYSSVVLRLWLIVCRWIFSKKLLHYNACLFGENLFSISARLHCAFWLTSCALQLRLDGRLNLKTELIDCDGDDHMTIYSWGHK